MKTRTLGRMGVLALALCLITSCLLGGTLAKYTSTVSGTGSATVASWSFKANGNATTIASIQLTDTTLGDLVTTGDIAPGTDGMFNIAIDASGSDVAVDYLIEISGVTNKPANMKFYTDSEFLSEISVNDSKYSVTGSIALSEVSTEVNVPIYWKWAYSDSDNGVADTGDQGKAMSFNIAVTGTQKDPTSAK